MVALMRAVLRHEGGPRGDTPFVLAMPKRWLACCTDQHLARGSLRIIGQDGDLVRLIADPWRPDWLVGGAHECGPEASLFERVPRRHDPLAAGDPGLDLLALQDYQSGAQREAVRAVECAKPGSTVIVNLPTGSGKSTCALIPALRPLPDAGGLLGVTPIVVPTVALALDLEARCRAFISHPTAYRPSDAAGFTARCRDGTQGPLFLAPEALVGAVTASLHAAAAKGYLRLVVVDEAHMINAWGDEFRPAFQQLAGARRALLEACSARPFVTLLMSATLTPYNLATLQDLFGSPGPVQYVHAVRLRPEPSYWFRRAPSADQQHAWLEEAVWHLPRPLILYTTQRKAAAGWYDALAAQGFSRIGLVDGASSDQHRAEVLRGWNADELDIVVATSAFGLGVDKPDVRAILHATLPEDIDRFYQDVGRAGRDGYGSLSLLIWTARDEQVAERLASPKFISVERGLERWCAMFQSERRQVGNGARFLVPLDERPSMDEGDIDMASDANEAWNVRTIMLMQRAGFLEVEAAVRAPYPALWVCVLRSDHTERAAWQRDLEPRRAEFSEARQQGLILLRQALVSGTDCIAETLARAYERSPDVPAVRACGGCPSCRLAGRMPYAGVLRARYSAPLPSARPVGRGVTQLLAGQRCAFVLYDRRGDLATLDSALREIVRWMLREGVTNFVAPRAYLDQWSGLFRGHPEQPAFFHESLVRGIVRDQPTAVFMVNGSPREHWGEVWAVRATAAAPTVIVAPDDLRQPGHPTRLASDVLAPCPTVTLTQWEDRYSL
jgi:superfamily II DNA helicase RecQ